MTRAMTCAVLSVCFAVAGCSNEQPKAKPGQVRAACEQYVKSKLKQQSVTFSDEQVDIGQVRTRASVKGVVDSAIASPAPGGPTRIRRPFMCAVEERQGGWNLVVLTGLDG